MFDFVPIGVPSGYLDPKDWAASSITEMPSAFSSTVKAWISYEGLRPLAFTIITAFVLEDPSSECA